MALNREIKLPRRTGRRPARPRNTIIIPVFNHERMTFQCLQSLLGTIADDVEVIVVNDASTDATAQMLAGFGQRIRVVKHSVNKGFAKSCNDGAAAATARDYLVFLNNDTIPRPGWLKNIVNYADTQSKAAIVGVKLVYPDNTIQHAGVAICQDSYPRHIYTGFPAHHPAVSTSRRFQIVTGACMLVRRKVFETSGGFDPKFRNGFEDVDFCLRCGERGLEIHYCADSVVQHLESVSPGRHKHNRQNVALYRKRWLARVQPDEFHFYAADGLLAAHHEGRYPFELEVAPELATMSAKRGAEAERKLRQQSRQIADLQRENTRMRLALHQHAQDSPELRYQKLRGQIIETAEQFTPRGAKILVISKGDGALLEIPSRRTGHFPQTPRGAYAGHHPADSAEAIAQLEALRAKGAEYLLFPATSFWWLEHYADFARHLETTGSLVQRNEAGVIYSLRRIKLSKPKRPARVIALLCARNEERFIGNCLAHLIGQGVQVYLLNHGSTDRTVEIAERWLERGLIAVENLPDHETFSLHAQLSRKEELAATLEADWFMHVDADEIHLPPRSDLTLAEALGAVGAAGYNAVNFMEFTFVPTRESPDHDHPKYRDTMRWGYPFLPQCPWAMRAWQRQPTRVGLVPSGGHRLQFPGLRLCPEFFLMKHYQFLSVSHAIWKYGQRRHDPVELATGLHGGATGWRARCGREPFALPSQKDLCEYHDHDRLKWSQPRTRHLLEDVTRAFMGATGD